ncbi:glycine betaine ABC transporter substrate-binding protein [[Mycobacterium] crassicus]|uniref:Glycine betaine ABC transporter substrate-binding protein n=1 Tax=[Mycobacterium] crassicus TaxID=2872309 RepID=A0ABU5XGM3_9MYCO|nr:glycine betaine ABC transporter substrate-binding protein [Mycolicibacter sp. MYC098]MEB3021033.1 glycine betaine ABC transporter substrate-binding protein [Mycolicibacter sp. MYC098]
MSRPSRHYLRRLAFGLTALLIAGCGGHPQPPVLSVGTTSDQQALVLAHLYASALRGVGAVVRVEPVADPVAEIDTGELTVVPGFSGRFLSVFAPDSPARSDRQVYWALAGALPEGIAVGDYAMTAADKPALAVTETTAVAWGGTDLRALVRHCAGLVVGAVTGARVPASVGSCTLPKARQFPDDAALFAALRARQVTAAWTSTADPGQPGDSRDTVVLTDGRPALVRAENVVPLYRRNALTEYQLLAINQVAGVLDTEALVEMRRAVAGGADPQVVVDAFLDEHPLGR